MAMPGSTAVAPVFLGQRRLQRGQEENHVLAFDVSKAFDTAPHGALALLLRHMGVQGGARQALPHPQLRVSAVYSHCARPNTEHSAPQGPAAGQCGERSALPPPLGTSLEEPCLQGAGRCSPYCAAPGDSIM